MIAAASVTLLFAACFGGGAFILRLSGVLPGLSQVERWAWSFALGFGLLGWTIFPFGVLGLATTPVFIGLGLLGLPGLALLGRPPTLFEDGDRWTWLLGALIAVVMVGDVLEALSPPADADSMAYHFAIPKQFIEAGRIVFIPRASDGAVPLLVQMTYWAALALGDEAALTWWCALTGWMAAFLVFAVARRFMPLNWSLLAGLVMLSCPALLYGAGTGQVEARTMLFVLVAAVAVADTGRTGNPRFACVAGLAAGFFMASKYPGLIYAFCAFVVLVARRPSVKAALAFGIAAWLAGGEWYLWNWWHTGDPVYPVLAGVLEYRPGVPWSLAQSAAMAERFFNSEIALPRTLLWLVAYPFYSSVVDDPVLETGRVGLGPYLLVAAPFVIAALVKRGRQAWQGTLLPVGAIAFLYYVIWFFIGPSQRVRHLLVLFPLLVLGATAACEWLTRGRGERTALLAGIAATLALQIFAQALFVVKFIPYVTGREDRAQFLQRNIGFYDVVSWANANLSSTDRLFVTYRQTIYLFDVPVFYGHPDVEARVETRETLTDPRPFWRQLREQRVTHLLIPVGPDGTSGNPSGHGYSGLVHSLERAGCTRVTARLSVIAEIRSRTLPSLSGPGARVPMNILSLAPEVCSL